MKAFQKIIDNTSAETQTWDAKEYGEKIVANALKWVTDADKVQRKKALECKTCFYLKRGRIGGCAMTDFPCGICGIKCMAGSTNTDRLCANCSKEHQLCIYCGSDLELRVRRKFNLPSPVKVEFCTRCDYLRSSFGDAEAGWLLLL